MAKAKVGKRTRRGITQESKWWARQAQRLGVTSRWLRKVWTDVKREQARYRSWRNRWIQSMARESGLPVSVIEGMEGIPPRLGADIEDFKNTKQMRAYIEQMKRTRESRNAARKQMREAVKRARQKVEEHGDLVWSERDIEAFKEGMTPAQITLLNRISGACLLTERRLNELIKEIAQMSDAEIAAFYEEDDEQIFRWLEESSPKLLDEIDKSKARHGARRERELKPLIELDAGTNDERYAHFLEVLRNVRTQ